MHIQDTTISRKDTTRYSHQLYCIFRNFCHHQIAMVAELQHMLNIPATFHNTELTKVIKFEELKKTMVRSVQ